MNDFSLTSRIALYTQWKLGLLGRGISKRSPFVPRPCYLCQLSTTCPPLLWADVISLFSIITHPQIVFAQLVKQSYPSSALIEEEMGIKRGWSVET